MTDPTMPPPPPTGNVSPNRTIMIVLSYLGILALIPLLVEKDDKEVQWHAKHGLVLMVAEFILWIGMMVLMIPLAMLTKGLSGCLIPIVAVGIFIFHILCIVKGVNGQRIKIPVLSDFPDKF